MTAVCIHDVQNLGVNSMVLSPWCYFQSLIKAPLLTKKFLSFIYSLSKITIYLLELYVLITFFAGIYVLITKYKISRTTQTDFICKYLCVYKNTWV
jgi:hypothetical protein